VLTSGDTLSTLSKTLVLTAVVVPVTIVGSLLLALLLNRRMRGRGLLRTLIYLPAVVPPVASALIWKVIFDRNSGAANRMLGLFNVNPVSWLTGGNVFIVLIVVLLWGSAPASSSTSPRCRPSRRTSSRRRGIDGAGAFKAGSGT
jgi:multiple sugar transport system permease protein